MKLWFIGYFGHRERCLPCMDSRPAQGRRQAPDPIRWGMCLTFSIFCILLASPNLSFGQTVSDAPELKQSGTVEIEQVQIAFLYSGNLGGGRLHYQGKTYKFTIGGLGIGGIGVSKIEATGEVYNLNNLSDFPGAYGQARYGYALDTESTGEPWLHRDMSAHDLFARHGNLVERNARFSRKVET